MNKEQTYTIKSIRPLVIENEQDSKELSPFKNGWLIKYIKENKLEVGDTVTVS